MNGSSPTAASQTPANAERAATAPTVAVACSAGPDSTALLWVVWRCASALGIRTLAFHVHHGLQPVSKAWPRFLEDECARWARLHPQWPAVGVRVCHLKGRPGRGQSTEAWAREGRYEALRSMAVQHGVDLLLLGHHRQDQAETFLLQALRGAGPQGLAGMPFLQWRDGVCWARPFLGHDRSALRHVLEDAQLRSVEDPSNSDLSLARNALRHDVWPALTQAFAAAEKALALAAQRCAQSLDTLERGVEADQALCVAQVSEDGRCWRLDVAAWGAMSPARRSQLLRAWFNRQGVHASSASMDQLAAHTFDKRGVQRWPLDERNELRWYRSALTISPIRPTNPVKAQGLPGEGQLSPAPVQWRAVRPGSKRLPAWGGRLLLQRAAPEELGAALSLPAVFTIRPRQGDDQFQLTPRGTARALKKQFQARAVAAWDRIGPVVADELGAVLWVPGLGWDARVAQEKGGWLLVWQAG